LASKKTNRELQINIPPYNNDAMYTIQVQRAYFNKGIIPCPTGTWEAAPEVGAWPATEFEPVGPFPSDFTCWEYVLEFFAYVEFDSDVVPPPEEEWIPADEVPEVEVWADELNTAAREELDMFKDETPDGADAWGIISSFVYDFSAWGDPHFMGFSGQWFDYHGECDLVLFESPAYENMGLTVHVRTTIRYMYSYIEAVAAKLGDDVFELGAYGNYAINGVEAADLKDATLGGFKIERESIDAKNTKFTVTLSEGKKLVFKSFKDLVSVGVEDGVMTAHGLLGRFVGRDGVTKFTDMNAYGQEWQVRDFEPKLFRTVRAPQFPEEKCRLPQVDAAEKKRRLGEGLARQKAEIACGRFSGAAFENCVFDVMAVGDIDIANAGAF
jgi:hypothetical protein